MFCNNFHVRRVVEWIVDWCSLNCPKNRFVLPVLPIALMFSGYWLATIGGPDKSTGRAKRSPSSHDRCSGKLQLAVLFLAVSNIPMAFYMSMVHQVSRHLTFFSPSAKAIFSCKISMPSSLSFFFCSCYSIKTLNFCGTYYPICNLCLQRGTEDVMNYLSVEANSGKVKSVLFFTPCHATPYYSTLHRNLPMRFLDCTPRYVLYLPMYCECLTVSGGTVFLSFQQKWTFVYSFIQWRERSSRRVWSVSGGSSWFCNRIC